MSNLPDDWTNERYALDATVRETSLATHFWSARDRETDDRVMIKAMRRDAVGGALEDFAREGKTVATLQHPNVLRLRDMGEAGPWAFHAYELADRRTLGDVIATGALPIDQALTLAAQLADALAYVHSRGHVHGFGHPGNIVVGANDQLKVTGFKFGWDLTGVFVPAYSAPEHVRSNERTERSDVYVFGAVLWEMLTGQRRVRPAGASRAATLDFHRDSVPPDLGAMIPGAPRWLGRLVASCLAENPAARPQSMEEVCIALEGRVPPRGLATVTEPFDRVAGRLLPRPLPAILADLRSLRSPALCVFRLIDLSEVMIKLATVAAIRRDGASIQTLPSLPSLGHWCSVLRAHRKAIATDAPDQLFNFADRAVQIRNAHKGHAALADSVLYDEVLRKDADAVASALATVPLFSQIRWESGELQYREIAVERPDLARLFPCKTCGRDEVFVFNGEHHKRRNFLSYETGHVGECS